MPQTEAKHEPRKSERQRNRDSIAVFTPPPHPAAGGCGRAGATLRRRRRRGWCRGRRSPARPRRGAGIILRRDDPAGDHLDVGAAHVLERLDHLRDQRPVPAASKLARPRRPHARPPFARSRAGSGTAGRGHLEADADECRQDQICAAVLAVLAHLGAHDPAAERFDERLLQSPSDSFRASNADVLAAQP